MVRNDVVLDLSLYVFVTRRGQDNSDDMKMVISRGRRTDGILTAGPRTRKKERDDDRADNASRCCNVAIAVITHRQWCDMGFSTDHVPQFTCSTGVDLWSDIGAQRSRCIRVSKKSTIYRVIKFIKSNKSQKYIYTYIWIIYRFVGTVVMFSTCYNYATGRRL